MNNPAIAPRHFCLAVTLAVAAVVSPLSVSAKTELLYIGMHGGKIHGARFDTVTGDMAALGEVADNLRPTWAVRHPVLPVIWFNEDGNPVDKGPAGIHTLKVNRKTGAVEKIGDARTGSTGTTHFHFDRISATMIAANNSGGTLVSLPVNKDGTLGAVVSKVVFSGSGPHPRQASPRPHGVYPDSSGKFILVPDLGSDRIWVMPFDRKSRAFGPYAANDPRHVVITPGAGPRHLAFHPSGKTVYLINELIATVMTFGWDGKAGKLTPLQTLTTDAPGFTGTKSASEIAVSSDGRFVYTANRGDHALVVHRVDPKTKLLSQIQRIPSGGQSPWHFAIHPSGKWLITANRNDNVLALFLIDRKSGMLTNTGKSLASPSPVHVIFIGL